MLDRAPPGRLTHVESGEQRHCALIGVIFETCAYSSDNDRPWRISAPSVDDLFMFAEAKDQTSHGYFPRLVAIDGMRFDDSGPLRSQASGPGWMRDFSRMRISLVTAASMLNQAKANHVHATSI